MEFPNVVKLSDQTIAQIVRLIQMGILTGTDVSDQLRTLELVVNTDENKVDPCQDYMATFEKNLEKLQEQATRGQRQEQAEALNQEDG